VSEPQAGETVRAERRGDGGRVALVTIDRPERRNALDHATLDALLAALRDAADARVVVLTGAGGHFCAGADLSTVEDRGFTGRLRQVLDSLCDASQPVIAAVAGAALGAGTQLAVACDAIVATPDAKFGIPAAKLGLMVDHWTVQRLATVAGHGPARAMLLTAEVLDGASLHRTGMVTRIGDVDDALAWADDVAALAPLTLAGHKLMLNRLERDLGDDHDVDAAYRRAWSSGDLQEGQAAFRERRAPVFRGE
jgi:enoyl-CoA hydratase